MLLCCACMSSDILVKGDKRLCVCVCVCVYIYICVCVCVSKVRTLVPWMNISLPPGPSLSTALYTLCNFIV
jgi:hypothetical protein